ncbi:type I-C CRISPR-associated protein Cas5 [Sphingomonas sp. NBWT7]|uniref:type I-C CRISPR-associated protein Cas5c n=1 Tax=Sphingomonas sp. NBWT7 TaxID=2596913 RepID=UPI0016245110|nr:type I-C CRISPR-associated protein Cas5c [Sphingomonas sp. NBWT7]QNE31712.1 type I-C CRISPR-associated protein Cas5 [Sphingomonas sp. NBWT7]
MDDERSIGILVRGNTAYFPRPEFRRDQVSYDALTPAAAHGILDRIHWRPAIRWVVDAIAVLNPIVFAQAVPSDKSHVSSRSVFLRDVGYLIDAHFELTERAGSADEPSRHRGMFRRQVRKGTSVFLGSDAHPATVALCDDVSADALRPIDLTQDLGWMVHGPDFSDRGRLRFFRAQMMRGIIVVPPPGSPEIYG